MPKTIVIVAGATAVGKTELAIQLALHYNTSIISADSRQCYQEMNIGTAKPNTEDLNSVKHYFINTHSITIALNAADFEHLSLRYIEDIFTVKDVVIVCGGTGLYIKALCEGIDEMPAISQEVVRKLQVDYENKGIGWLQETLLNVDSEFFKVAEKQNPHRLLRALAFKISTGKSILEFRTKNKKNRDFNIIKIGLEIPRSELYHRINKRVDHMMEKGLLAEVRSLLPHRHLKNLNTVGYSELFDYLDGKSTLERAVDLIKQHSRNYAKRQQTWFKKDVAFHWFSPEDIELIFNYLKNQLSSFRRIE